MWCRNDAEAIWAVNLTLGSFLVHAPIVVRGRGECWGGQYGGVGCPPKHEKVGGGECMLCAAPSPVVMNGEVHHNSIAPLARLDNGMRGRSEAEEVHFSAPSLSLVQDALFYY